MARRLSTATTRTTRSINVPVARSGQLLISGQAIQSPETGLRYRIERLLGEGGFGQAYLATRLGKSADVPETVCIKVSPRVDGWIREAYFGQLLDGHPRALRVFDLFPLMRADGQVLYYPGARIRRPRRPERVPRPCREGAWAPKPWRRRLVRGGRTPRNCRHPRRPAEAGASAHSSWFRGSSDGAHVLELHPSLPI